MASSTKKTNKHRDAKRAKLSKARNKKLITKKRADKKRGVLNP